MDDLLKEAIADAKAVRETALENAKMALVEAFTPRLQNMLSQKIQTELEDEEGEEMEDEMEEDDEDPSDEDSMDAPVDDEAPMDDEEEDVAEISVNEEDIIEIDGVKYAPVVSEEDEEDMGDEEMGDEEEDMEESDDLDLEAVIKELESELDEAEEVDEVEEGKEEVDEQSKSSEIGKADNKVDAADANDEEDPGNSTDVVKMESIQSELAEYKEAVHFLKDKLHEVNILNAKLLFTNKLFKEFTLNNNQKLKVVETFDRAQTTREIKLVYSTLAEQFGDNSSIASKKSINESASAKSGTTKPSKASRKVITEETQVANRFKKLAGLL